jgi:hypothetical protein
MEITSLNQLDLVNGIYSYADYLVWKIKERVELLKGKILEMSVSHRKGKAKYIQSYNLTCVWSVILRK